MARAKRSTSTMLIVSKEQEEQCLFITSFRKIIRILLLDLFFGQRENIRTSIEKWSSQNQTSWTGSAALVHRHLNI